MNRYTYILKNLSLFLVFSFFHVSEQLSKPCYRHYNSLCVFVHEKKKICSHCFSHEKRLGTQKSIAVL